MHYDQEALYNTLISFQNDIGSEGIEVTESDLLEVWRKAKETTSYFKED